MLRHFLWLPLWVSVLTACSATALTDTANAAYHLQILDSVTVPRELVQGHLVAELSDLAWDEDEQVLYAISDRGKLFHFKLSLAQGRITELKPIAVHLLVDKKGQRLKRIDSEGLIVLKGNDGKTGNSQLVVSLEYKPALLRINPQGRELGAEAIHADLKDRHAYRSGNDMLEAVIRHPRYGYITAPERPLKQQPDSIHTVYSAKAAWSFPTYPAPNSAITSLEMLPDQSLLVLERAWSGFPNPMVISLRRVDLKQCSNEGLCAVQDLTVISSLFSVDNFEGLTHIKDNLYLMVSDDGQHDLLRTRMTLFKVE